VALGLLAVLASAAVRTQWATGPGRPPSATTAEIGKLFLTDFLLPFEAASILLLVALIGAALIVRRRRDA
jgi:NADH:ubiquinone oxidoreductase subunit 6 (subunit J)